MSSQQPLTALTEANASHAERDDDTSMTLDSQAEDIIRTVLSGTDPTAAPARHRLRSLLAVHPGDHIAVLRHHLIQTRAPLSPPPDRAAVNQRPEMRPRFITTTDGERP